VEKGADIENKDNYEWPPLFDASWKGHFGIVKIFSVKGR